MPIETTNPSSPSAKAVYDRQNYQAKKAVFLIKRRAYRATPRGRLFWLYKEIKRKHPECDFDVLYLLKMYKRQQGKCKLTGTTMALEGSDNGRATLYSLSIDRINSRRGYVKRNIQLVTYQANMAKSIGTNEQFYSMCRLALEEKQ